jgi:hypothetical protein
MSQGDIVGRVSAQCHYIALTICAYGPILYSHALQQTEKIRREIQNPQIVQQTISLNAKRSTLVAAPSTRLNRSVLTREDGQLFQDCQTRLPGETAGQDCRARLPGKIAGQDCRARAGGPIDRLAD